MYNVKEIFFSIQGEGAYCGRTAVFCRFSGCNLWNGRESDRSTSICDFCDTDFVGVNEDGGKFASAEELAEAIHAAWPEEQPDPNVICTGGEPLLQLDEPLVAAIKAKGFHLAIETNGTLLTPQGINWICVSPKIGAELRLVRGNELKLVYPQANCNPADFETLDFERFFLQPKDGSRQKENIAAAHDHCERNPKWELSIQIQKLAGIR